MSAAEQKQESEEGVSHLRRPQLEDDPAIFLHFYVDRVHNALALPNAPCHQQGTAGQSVAVFQRYVYELMLGAGPNEDENGVEDDGARAGANAPGTDYFPFVLHRLYEDQYRSVVKRLRDHFMKGQRPVTQWSLQLPQPLGVVMKVTGGTGTGAAFVTPGAAFVTPEAMGSGAFRYP